MESVQFLFHSRKGTPVTSKEWALDYLSVLNVYIGTEFSNPIGFFRERNLKWNPTMK